MPTISKKRVLFFLIGCFFFFLFTVFTLIVRADLLINFDFDMTVRLQDNIPRRFDTFFSYFSVLGSVEITGIMLLVMLIVRRKVDGFFILFGFGAFLLIELFGKVLLDHPGPPFLFARYKSLVEFPTSYIPHPHSAYPSGHSGRTVFLAVLTVFFILSGKNPFTPVRLALTGFVIGFVIIMLVSRVYLGEHWTTDVTGGSLLAASLAFFTMSVLNLKKFKKAHHEDT